MGLECNFCLHRLRAGAYGSRVTDRVHMVAALEMAESGLGHVWPNPSVGAVVVAGGRPVGRGRTQVHGRPHAEVVALRQAGEAARGGTMFVSLEPCCHFGRTPPCTTAVLEAGLARVVVATLDPDPRVDGRGVELLRAAGVQVEVGLESGWAESVNAGFFTRVRLGRPWFAEVKCDPGIPDSFDAVWRSGPEGSFLEVRTGAAGERWAVGADPRGVAAWDRWLDVSPERAAARLAAEGLTRVAVECGSPVARLLAQQGQLDRPGHPPTRG